MRVLIAASIYPPDAGGPAVHARAHFEQFPQYGIETELVALAHYRSYPSGIRHLLYFLSLLPKVRRCSLVYAYDAVGAGLPALIAVCLFRRKLILRIGGDLAWERAGEKRNISLRDWYEEGEYQKDLMYRLSKFVLKGADKIIVTTSLLKELYENYYGISPDKIEVIINPIEIKGTRSSTREKTIIFASRLTSYKNLDLSLRALAPIFREHGDLKLIFLGDGPEKTRLQSIAINEGIENQVEFRGHVSQEEVIRETSTCLFTLAPALTEFNPNYLLQGIGLGKPFIVSWENGLPFEVPEFLRFNASSEDDLRERVTFLLTEKGYAQAENFVKKLDIKMSWEDNLRGNIRVIQELLNGSK
ncbi:MAG: glycosyltransferase family 4 protein [Candidatus Zambryskibacteria bacterium]|nr:glycosyltransferase family 4 protein [Candidatus Zambryskibacteria bacterium]